MGSKSVGRSRTPQPTLRRRGDFSPVSTLAAGDFMGEMHEATPVSHTRSLPPAHPCSRNRARRIARKPTGPATQFPQLISDAGPDATTLFQLPTDRFTLRQMWHSAFNSQPNDRITSGLPTTHPESAPPAHSVTPRAIIAPTNGPHSRRETWSLRNPVSAGGGWHGRGL